MAECAAGIMIIMSIQHYGIIEKKCMRPPNNIIWGKLFEITNKWDCTKVMLIVVMLD